MARTVTGKMGTSVPAGASMKLERQKSAIPHAIIASPRTVAMPSYAAAPTRGARARTQSDQGKENSCVQIVERKGDVVVCGPARSQDGSRLPRIICYGDSNTAGFCNDGRKFQPYGQSLAAELAEAGAPCEVIVCGLCSFTTQDMINERASSVVRTQIGPSGRGLVRMLEEDGLVDLVLIMTGTNDMGFGIPNATIVKHIAQLHAICHDRGIPTVAMSPTQGSGMPCRKIRQELADMIAKWSASSTGVLDCVDVEDILPRRVGRDGRANLPALAEHWEKDDLHISAAGSLLFGRRLAPRVSSWLQNLSVEGTTFRAATKSPTCSVAAPPVGPPRSSIAAPPVRSPLVGMPRTNSCHPAQASSSLMAARSTSGCGYAMNGQRRQHHSNMSPLVGHRQVQLCM